MIVTTIRSSIMLNPRVSCRVSIATPGNETGAGFPAPDTRRCASSYALEAARAPTACRLGASLANRGSPGVEAGAETRAADVVLHPEAAPGLRQPTQRDDVGRGAVHRDVLRTSRAHGADLEGQARFRGQERSRSGECVVLFVGVDDLGGGQGVAEARLSRLVLRARTSTEEGRDGDGKRDRDDELDHHQLDECEPTLIPVPPGPQRGDYVHCIPLWLVGLSNQP